MTTRRSFSQQQQHMGSFICRRLWFRGCSVHRAMEAWKACAGPLVDVPKIKERVYYFPQGRMEQLEASTNEELNQKITMFNLPSKILCRVLNFQLLRRSPLLIVAEDVESEALTMLIINQHRAGLKVCAVKAPGFGDNRRANLEDLSILTRGEVISKDHGLSLDKVNINMLGSAKKVTVSLDDTIILHGGGDKKLIEERCEQ